MDSSLQSRSPDNSDVKPSFRKPSNDAANRKYRRRSPVGGSASSSSDGSPRHDRSAHLSREDTIKRSDDRYRRKDDRRDLDRDCDRNRSLKDADSHRYSERQSYSNSQDNRRHDDYSRHRRHADEDERTYQRSSRSARESRSDTRSDYRRLENDHDRAREDWRNSDKYSRDRSDDRGHRSREKEREVTISERHRNNDKELSSDRNTDDKKTGERDRHQNRGDRVEKRDYRNDYSKDSTMSRDNGGICVKETHKSSSKELEGQKEDMIQKRKHSDRERDKHRERYDRDQEEHVENHNKSSSHRGREARNEQYQDKNIPSNEDHDSVAKKLKSSYSEKSTVHAEDGQVLSKSSKFTVDQKQASSSKQIQDTVGKSTSEPVCSSASGADVTHDLNAARVAAMKAAELVNRNLVGGAYLSTDQKKKLLWGNKKNTAAEESGNHWDMSLFSDRERQEKFKKLMGVKGDLKPENNTNEKDRAEKQEQLQLELEKQYTAGLRRRDGRTVGLGL